LPFRCLCAILVWDFRGIFVAFCLVNRGWLLVNTERDGASGREREGASGAKVCQWCKPLKKY